MYTYSFIYFIKECARGDHNSILGVKYKCPGINVGLNNKNFIFVLISQILLVEVIQGHFVHRYFLGGIAHP